MKNKVTHLYSVWDFLLYGSIFISKTNHPYISTIAGIVVISKFLHCKAFFAANKISFSTEIVFQGIQTEALC